MLIDCDACAMQDTDACEDCLVTFLMVEEGVAIRLDETEEAALEHLAAAGMVAPLRLVPRYEAGGKSAAG